MSKVYAFSKIRSRWVDLGDSFLRQVASTPEWTVGLGSPYLTGVPPIRLPCHLIPPAVPTVPWRPPCSWLPSVTGCGAAPSLPAGRRGWWPCGPGGSGSPVRESAGVPGDKFRGAVMRFGFRARAHRRNTSRRGTPLSRTACPTLSSLPYPWAVSIRRYPASSAQRTAFTHAGPLGTCQTPRPSIGIWFSSARTRAPVWGDCTQCHGWLLVRNSTVTVAYRRGTTKTPSPVPYSCSPPAPVRVHGRCRRLQ